MKNIKIPIKIIEDIIEWEYKSLIENSHDGRELCKALENLEKAFNDDDLKKTLDKPFLTWDKELNNNKKEGL